MMKKWLETVFDPYTRAEYPARKQQLLIIDGHGTYVQVSFLDCCCERSINCLILPANMTSIFQPLNVASFNQLKSACHSKAQAHLLSFNSTSLSIGSFWRWHQQAWREMAVSRNIRPAWKKLGLWPLDQLMMQLDDGNTSTPPPSLSFHEPSTPSNIHIGCTNSQAVWRGDLSPGMAFFETKRH